MTPLYARIVAFIDRSYASPVGVQELAAMAGLSRAHFIRRFRAEAGVTPHQYLRRRRIERACELLVRTPMPITEICEAVGFTSLGSFCSLFRRETGETAAAYRAKRRKPPIIPGCFLRMHRVR